MRYPEVIHHGATATVTGSCHQLHMDSIHSVLIDSGVFQESVVQAVAPIEFSLLGIKALILTHVHADHAGRIPELLAAGFSGPILCSEASARLLPLMLEDALRLRPGINPQQLDRYLAILQQRTIGLPFGTWFPLVQSPELVCRVRLQRAGHILGSAYVEFDVQYPLEGRDKRVVFSGDLGASETPILPTPKSPERADVLVLESTYGDRVHQERSTRQERLEKAIDKALADNGTVLIPAFSIGRTQELLYELEDILHRKALLNSTAATVPDDLSDDSTPTFTDWPRLPIILDSPLASRVTQVYLDFADVWDREARERLDQGRKSLGFDQLITIDSHARHQQTVDYLASTARPAIVIAGNGMCAGGRITNYLKAMLHDKRHNVIFVGYQAKGTPGAAIQAHGPKGGYVELDRERYEINAQVSTISGYSAHADQQGLVEFVVGMDVWPEEIRLVHGEAQAKKALGQVFERRYSLSAKALSLIVPRERFE